MKILHIISGNLGQGGAERLVVDLAKAQADLGHDVSICCFREAANAYAIDERISFHSFNKKRGLSLTLPFSIAAYIHQSSFDVVNAHLSAVFLYLILSVFVCGKVSFFYTIHSNLQGEEKRNWVRNLRRILFKHKITPVAISQQIAIGFSKIHKLSEVPVIENGSRCLFKSKKYTLVYEEINRYKKKETTKVFIAVGRVSKEKNHLLLVEAINQIKEDVILLVVGNRTDDEIWKDCQRQNKGKTYFLGSKNNVEDYLLCADFFCMSSLYEGLPISMIEAMSVGLPIISTNVGGIPDIVKDGINGFLVPDFTPVSYAKKLKKALLMTDEEYNKMAQQNKLAFMQKYDISITAKKYVELYLTVVKTRGLK